MSAANDGLGGGSHRFGGGAVSCLPFAFAGVSLSVDHLSLPFASCLAFSTLIVVTLVARDILYGLRKVFYVIVCIDHGL